MKLIVKWSKTRERWDILDEKGYCVLPDIPNCRNFARLFPDLDYEKPNYYNSQNDKLEKI